MDEIQKAFSSPAWWVLTVLVSLLVNLASGWMQPWLTKRIRQRNEVGRNRAIAAHHALVDESARIAQNGDTLTEAILEELRLRAKAANVLMLTMFAFLIYMWIEPNVGPHSVGFYISLTLLLLVGIFGAVYIAVTNLRVKRTDRIEYARAIQQGLVKADDLNRAGPGGDPPRH